MKSALIASCAVLAMFGLAACAETTAATVPPGHYSKTSTSVDANGTEHKTKSTTDVSVDQYGNKTVNMDKKSSMDPSGWFNKSTTESHTTVKQNQ